MKKRLSLLFATVISLALLAGCGEKKAKEVAEDDVVLLKVDKKTAVTKNEFYKELSASLRNMDPSLVPLNMQRRFLDDLMRLKLVVAAAEKEGLDRDSDFIKAYDEQCERLKELLLTRFYDKKIFDDLDVSDTETEEDFAKNKTKYIKEPGGVAVTGVSFKNKEKAMAFYDKVKGKITEFETIGKKEKDGTFKDFGRVSAQEAAGSFSVVPETIKAAALNLTKTPAVDVVKEGKQTWVISVSDKKEATLYELDEIKDQLKNQLKVNKFMEARNKKVEELKKEFEIEVNENFFKESKPAEVAETTEEVDGEETEVKESTPENKTPPQTS